VNIKQRQEIDINEKHHLWNVEHHSITKYEQMKEYSPLFQPFASHTCHEPGVDDSFLASLNRNCRSYTLQMMAPNLFLKATNNEQPNTSQYATQNTYQKTQKIRLQ
jgi:hypothetical protein